VIVFRWLSVAWGWLWMRGLPDEETTLARIDESTRQLLGER